jgi:hypothetical protein
MKKKNELLLFAIVYVLDRMRMLEAPTHCPWNVLHER